MAEVQTGPFGTVLKAEEYSELGVPLISVGEIRRGHIQVSKHTPRISDEIKRRLPDYVLKEGDIVFGRKGAIDRNAIISSEQDGWFLGSDGIRLRLNNEFDSVFLSYQLRCPAIGEWLLRNSSGSIMPSLNQKILDRLPVWLTDEADQRRIASVLSTLDEKIELNNRINAELEALSKLIYDYWFVQFDFPISAEQATSMGRPDLEGKPYRSSGGPMVYNSTLKRKIPVGWEAVSFEKAYSLNYGKALKKENQKPGDVPVYGSNGIYGYHDKYLIEAPGIIVGRKGSVGALKWAYHNFFPTDTSYYLGVSNPFTFQFAWHQLSSFGLDRMNSDSAVPGLSRSNVYGLKVLKPEDCLIRMFSQKDRLYRDLIKTNLQQNRELTQLRDWLLPMLMSGQVTVR
jgi:type I restriction enzyme S subunit